MELFWEKLLGSGHFELLVEELFVEKLRSSGDFDEEDVQLLVELLLVMNTFFEEEEEEAAVEEWLSFFETFHFSSINLNWAVIFFS